MRKNELESDQLVSDILTAEQLIPRFPAWWLTLTVACLCAGGLVAFRTQTNTEWVKDFLPNGLIPVLAFAIFGGIQAAAGLSRIIKWKARRDTPNGWDLVADRSSAACQSHGLEESVPVQLRQKALKEFQISLQLCLDQRCRPLLLLSFLVSVMPIVCFGLFSSKEMLDNPTQSVYWIAVGVAFATAIWFVTVLAIVNGRSAIAQWYDAACLRRGLVQTANHEHVIQETINKPTPTSVQEHIDDVEDVLSPIPVTPQLHAKRRNSKTRISPEDDLVINDPVSTEERITEQKDSGQPLKDQSDDLVYEGSDDYLGDDPLQNQ